MPRRLSSIGIQYLKAHGTSQLLLTGLITLLIIGVTYVVSVRGTIRRVRAQLQGRKSRFRLLDEVEFSRGGNCFSGHSGFF